MEQKLHDIGFGNDLLDITPKAQATEATTDKLDFKPKTSVYQGTLSTE